MVEVRIAELDSFEAVGKKVWISGQDNSQFGAFWSACHEDGTIAALRALSKEPPDNVTKAYTFGVSRVEKDFTNRAFWFYIAAEPDDNKEQPQLERFTVPAAKWAVFSNRGELPMSRLRRKCTRT